MADDSDPGPRPRDLEKENRALARKLAAHGTPTSAQMEVMQDATSKVLSQADAGAGGGTSRDPEALLLNILPKRIIDRLEGGEQTIADRFPELTVLFSDIVGFTETSSAMPPDQLVSELNGLFSGFDELCERTGVEKIKTIGDAYMAVAGLPDTRSDHVAAIADLALGMRDQTLGRVTTDAWSIRIGIHTGPAVAGVIGKRKFVYDVWGDTVNVASRLETSAEPGRIHISEPVADALRGSFDTEPRGTVELKGKGSISTHYLIGPARKPD